jgi:small GTP-binding protein
MSEIAKKVCMLGDFGVGKTSLVARFVRNTFSDKYLTTVGVKVDSKLVQAAGAELKLVLWDIAGKSSLDGLNETYVKGASGVIVVCDGTRESTLRSAAYLQMQIRGLLGPIPAVMLINKLDLVDKWEIAPKTIEELRKTMPLFETSAMSGDGVEAAFTALAEALLAGGTRA